MVAVDGEVFGQIGKDALLGGVDDAGLAVHELLGADDAPTKRCAYALVPQAHTQNRQLAREMLDGRDRNACFGG